MDKKVSSIIAYIPFIGPLISYFVGDKDGAKFHINQGLVITLGFLCTIILGKVLGWIPIIGWIIGIVLKIVDILLVVCIVLGLISAFKGEDKEIPFLGIIKILK